MMKRTAHLTGLPWSPPLPNTLHKMGNHVELLFDPDLTAATGIILFIPYFIDILTNFFVFFPSVSFSISHHSPFFSHRVTLLTPLAPVATHPGCHYVVTLSLCGLGFALLYPLIHPLHSPLPLSACVSIRFVWQRIWLRPRPGCLSCS